MDVYALTNMHNPPAPEGRFCDEHGNVLKPQLIHEYIQHTGNVCKGDRMSRSYSIQRQKWKWTGNLFSTC
jgi:hypothetical protein